MNISKIGVGTKKHKIKETAFRLKVKNPLEPGPPHTQATWPVAEGTGLACFTKAGLLDQNKTATTTKN